MQDEMSIVKSYNSLQHNTRDSSRAGCFLQSELDFKDHTTHSCSQTHSHLVSCPGAISVFGKLAGDKEEAWEALLGPKFRPRQLPLALANPFLQRKTLFP